MKKILIYLFPMVLMASCVDSLDDYNIDQKLPTTVPPATLFTNAVKNMTDVLTTPNVNTNNYRFYVQHWTATQYMDEPRYNMTARLIPQNMFQTLYRDVLMDLKEAKTLLQEDQFLEPAEKNNQLAQVEIMEVYAWSVLVNTFGDVPYSQALDPENSLPAYDDAQTIYNDILNRLNTGLGLITTSEEGFDEGDVLYNGDMQKWMRFGNSLKLKLAMVIADVDPGQAQTLVEAAAPNVFTSNDDNAVFPYLSAAPNNNPVSENLNPARTAREDFIAANTLVDIMNELDDPRRQLYFSPIDGEYVGGIYGFPNEYANFSKINELVIGLDFEALLLDYSEVEFLLAEAVERGFNVGGSAQSHYNNAIRASFDYWAGLAGASNIDYEEEVYDVEEYLAQPAVNYTTASGDWKEKIGVQKWIALFNRGYDAWLAWRRLDAPTLLPPVVEGSGALIVPTRLIYPINEQTLNGTNRTAAAEAIGGDESSTKLWWDVN